MNIDEITYGEMKEIVKLFNTANATDKPGIGKDFIGKYVIVRSYSEGINAGTVVEMDETGVVLKDARRIWYHRPANKSQAWYEGVALSGLSDDSKVSAIVPHKVIMERYSITECSNEAIKSIQDKKSHAQS